MKIYEIHTNVGNGWEKSHSYKNKESAIKKAHKYYDGTHVIWKIITAK